MSHEREYKTRIDIARVYKYSSASASECVSGNERTCRVRSFEKKSQEMIIENPNVVPPKDHLT